MNREDPYRRLTDETKQRIQLSYQKRSTASSEKSTGLPPRSEVHGEKRRKTKNKVGYPLIRLLAIFFILLPITIFATYSYRDKDVPVKTDPVDKGDHEQISIEDATVSEKLSSKEKKMQADAEENDDDGVTGNQGEDEADISTDEKQNEQVEEIKPALPPQDQTQPTQPAKQTAPPQTQQVEPQKVTYNKPIKHKVQANETLFRISMQYYKSQDGIEKIKQANNLKSDEIQEGQVLIIPQ